MSDKTSNQRFSDRETTEEDDERCVVCSVSCRCIASLPLPSTYSASPVTYAGRDATVTEGTKSVVVTCTGRQDQWFW